MENEITNKNKKTIIFGIIFLILILIGSTYAFFTYSKSSQAFVLTSNKIKAIFTAGTNTIEFGNAYPISDNYAISNLDKLTYLDFTVSGEVNDPNQSITYEIYLTEESGNTLSNEYVKVYLTDNNNKKIESEYNPTAYANLGYTTYPNSPNGRLVYKGNGLGNFSHDYRLYIWLDSSYEQNTVSQSFKFKVNLYAYNDVDKTLKAAFMNSLEEHTTDTCKTNVVEDGITYISGTKDCIDFNYVWYSGKLWRIIAIYPDGTMKMITDDVMTTIAFNSNADNGTVNFYTDENTKSYMYQWLNEDFLDTLYNYENIIVTDSKWNATNSNATSNSQVSTKLPETTMVTAPVGLLNSYEYYKSYQNTSSSNGYLNIEYYWRLLNPYSSSNVWSVSYAGNAGRSSPSGSSGVRPSINLKSTIQLLSGSGSKEDPYIINGDKEQTTPNTTFLNTRTSGEYVTFNNELYRIVSVENGITKLNKNDHVKDISNTVITKRFASSTIFGKTDNTQTSDYWDYYLNNDWYNSIEETSKNMLVDGTYYQKQLSDDSNYKGAVCKTASNIVSIKECAKTTTTWTGKVGLPRYGEMFASQQGIGSSNSKVMWLINPFSSSNVWNVSDGGTANYLSPSRSFGARPSVNLKSTIKITGGNGTKESPFILGE